MESCNALCSLILLCLIGASEGNFFSLPSNWKVAANDSSLPNYSTVQGPFRAVIDGNGNAIVSENSRTGLGFINVNSSGKFVLSVVLGLDLTSLPAMEIWTANRNRMVNEGAMLKLGSNGDMVLEDSDGTVVWNISVGSSKGILMAESGNLQIYNTTNSSLVSAGSNLVWQSWTRSCREGVEEGSSYFHLPNKVISTSIAKWHIYEPYQPSSRQFELPAIQTPDNSRTELRRTEERLQPLNSGEQRRGCRR